MRNSIPHLLSLLAACLTTLAASALAGPIVLHPKGEALPFAHQGPFVTTGDGGVLCVDAQDALVSHDDGRTWQKHPLFKDASRYAVSNERALLRTRDGVVIAAWMNIKEKKSPPGWNWGGAAVDYRGFVLPTYVCRSLDDGKTWEEPIFLNKPWCGCIHSMIETRSGRIVLVGQEIIPAWRHATVMFVSDDKGVTWLRSNVLDYGIGRHDHAGSCEGTAVERKDGSLYQLLRTESGFLYEATSADGGLTWEQFQKSGVRSVTCCAQLGRLADGRIALLWNHPPRRKPDDGRSREELSIAFSEDECRTWSKPAVIAARYPDGDDGPSDMRVSYPYLYERRPGELWVTTMQGGLRMKIRLDDISKADVPLPALPPRLARADIVMFGDSTTAPRPGSVQQVYSYRVRTALTKAGSSLTVLNAGIGANTTRDARKRFQRDVLDRKPKLMVMQFGINDAAVDVWKKPPATEPRVTLADYEANLRWMIEEARKHGVKVVLMTANPLRWTDRLKPLYGRAPYDPDSPDGFDKPLLRQYNDAARRVAKDMSVPLVDVHAAYYSFEKQTGKPMDSLLVDGMHPNDAGHQKVAGLLLPVIREVLR